jgi:hypothetical protein
VRGCAVAWIALVTSLISDRRVVLSLRINESAGRRDSGDSRVRKEGSWWSAPGSRATVDGRREAVRAFTARVKYVETGAPGRISTDGSVKWQAARVVITEHAAV